MGIFIFAPPPLDELMLKVDRLVGFFGGGVILYNVFEVHRAILFHKSTGLLQNKYLNLGCGVFFLLPVKYSEHMCSFFSLKLKRIIFLFLP